MQIAIASIDDAYCLSNTLDKQWFLQAEHFSDSRKRTFLAGRALLQKLLSKDDPKFKLPNIGSDEQGKPIFPDLTKIHFNISHSGDLIVVAVGNSAQGIDIERIRKRRSMPDLIKRLLSFREQDFIKNKDECAQLDDFILFWTLRECLLKLSGRGLGGLDDLKVFPQDKFISYPSLKLLGRTLSLKTDELLKNFKLKPSFPCWLTAFVPATDNYELAVLSDGELIDIKKDTYKGASHIFEVKSREAHFLASTTKP